ncbi:hypothetical protein, partial [Ilumatobacter sp.]
PEPVTTTTAPSTTAPSTTAPPTTAPSTTAPPTSEPPAPSPPSLSPDEIGDEVAGLFRPSVLGPGQKSCLGQVLVNEFGGERVVAAIASESPRDDVEFVEAIRAAANFCNIDPSAVLG